MEEKVIMISDTAFKKATTEIIGETLEKYHGSGIIAMTMMIAYAKLHSKLFCEERVEQSDPDN